MLTSAGQDAAAHAICKVLSFTTVMAGNTLALIFVYIVVYSGPQHQLTIVKDLKGIVHCKIKIKIIIFLLSCGSKPV